MSTITAGAVPLAQSGGAGARTSDHRRICRRGAGRRENLAAASARDRADRRRIFLRCHRFHGIRLAGAVHSQIRIRDRRRNRGNRQRHHFRPGARHCRAGRILRPVRPALHLSVQSFVVRRFHHPGRVRAERDLADRLPRSSPGSGSAPSSRWLSPMRANTRPSAFAAESWRWCISSAAPACGRSEPAS